MVGLRIVKFVARLILLFCATILIFSVGTAVVSFLYTWVLAADSLLPAMIRPQVALLTAFSMSIPLAFYAGMVAALGYTVRRGIPAMATYIILPILSVAALLSLQWGTTALMDPAEALPPVRLPEFNLPGMLVQAREGEFVYLGEASGSLKISDVDSAGATAEITTTNILFAPKFPTILEPIIRNFESEAGNLHRNWNRGVVYFSFSIACHAFMLASFRFVFGLTAWPLANTILGIFLFRWILSFALFLQSDGFSVYLASFFGDLLPSELISGAAMVVIGVVMVLQTALSYLARDKKTVYG